MKDRVSQFRISEIARKRRSPATISKFPLTGLTVIGCASPCAAMDAANCSSASWSKIFLSLLPGLTFRTDKFLISVIELFLF